MYEIGPMDCNEVGIIQEMIVGPCHPSIMTIVSEPGSMFWFWVGPAFITDPGGQDLYEFDYILINHSFVLGVEEQSWSGVKALFR